MLIGRTMSIDRVIAIVGVVGTVIGLWLAWYFYKASQPTRIPTFLVDPWRPLLAGGSSSETSDITILYKGRPIGQRAVNVVRVYFWNAGNTPITDAEILEPLTITISPNSEILEPKILRLAEMLRLLRLILRWATVMQLMLTFIYSNPTMEQLCRSPMLGPVTQDWSSMAQRLGLQR